jgi:hypothetical protein
MVTGGPPKPGRGGSIPSTPARSVTDERMLDVHHKNNDRNDNRLKNLEVLCVWCHALHTRNITPHPWNGKGL